MKEAKNSLRDHRKARGWTQVDLAERASTTVSEISKLERGERRMTVDWLDRLGVALGVNPADLMAPPGCSASSDVVALEVAPKKTRGGCVPIIGEVAAGTWVEAEARASEPIEWLEFMPNGRLPAAHTYAFKVRGTLLNKIAPDGAVLVCVDLAATGLTFRDGDLVVVERSRENSWREVTAKRVRFENGQNELWAESTDPKWLTSITRIGDDNGVKVAVTALVRYIVISV